MPQLGASRITAAYSTNGLSDASGIPLISSSNDFSASPLGIAARSQALYGIANAQFNLLPEDPTATIADNQNPLPYWSVMNYSDGRIVPLSYYDTATGTYSVELNPTAGSASDYIELKTRSYLLTDDNLALRQKAYLAMSKGTAYSGSTQFNVVLSAEYFDVNDASLSSYAIGTALDNTAMTSITGITTSGSAAINAAAAYVDFTIKLTATATVTSGVKVYLKSFIIQTSQVATGSFLITETLTTSQTYTPPTGVGNLVAVVVGGAGGGGGGGGLIISGSSRIFASGGGAGGGASWSIMRDYSFGTASSIAIGIGAGGAGGAGSAITKPLGSADPGGAFTGANGANGGATTFGSFVTVPGGTGGRGAGGTSLGASGSLVGGSAGGAGAAASFTYFGQGTAILGAAGGTGAGANSGNGQVGFSSPGTAWAQYPYTTFSAGETGATGTLSTASTGTANPYWGRADAGAAGGTALFGGGGGGGGAIYRNTTSGTAFSINTAGAGGAGGGGGGGGVAALQISVGGTAQGTATITAGRGGNGGALSSGGGGGGGGAAVMSNSTTNCLYTVTAGAGGTGSTGFVTVVYVA
jgi:hypothetical protein